MKAKIFVGPRDSGKTRVAKMIADHVGIDKTFIIYGRRPIFEDSFIYHGMNTKTKLIIFDDVPLDFDYKELFKTMTHIDEDGDMLFRIKCNTKGEWVTEHYIPQIIITTTKLDSKWYELGDSFRRRFDVIDFPLCKTNY